MASRTPQNNSCNEQKRKICTPRTCVLHFGTFICRPRPGSDVNWPSLRLCRGRENVTKNLKFLPKQLYRSCQFIPAMLIHTFHSERLGVIKKLLQ